MSLLKCEMCGGTLIPEDNGAYAVCEYCGTRISASPDNSSDKNIELAYPINTQLTTTTLIDF